MLSIFFNSSFLNIFTLAYFIPSTTLIISLSFTFDYLTFSSRLTSFTITSIFSVLLTCSYSGFTNVLFSLSLSTSISQSSLLLRLFTFPILFPRTFFSIKSNLDIFRAHLACYLFNFCAFIKYSSFL